MKLKIKLTDGETIYVKSIEISENNCEIKVDANDKWKAQSIGFRFVEHIELAEGEW